MNISACVVWSYYTYRGIGSQEEYKKIIPLMEG